MTATTNGHDDEDAKALESAFRRLLVPLVKLAVSKGLPYAAVDEWLRSTFVKAAYQTHPELPPHRRASRVSAATGLHRREVQRLLADSDSPAPPAPSLAAEVFAHWRSAPGYLDGDRQPRILPRTGPAPSFESLAHAITRDVHPRTLLEELLRLNLAQRNLQDDTVALMRAAFVPSKDLARMAEFLGANVGDHLSGAVSNVLGEDPRHFDQAMFAEGLSDESMAEVRAMVTTQWKALTDGLVPALEKMLERDAARDPSDARLRLRLGLYSFQAPTSDPVTTSPDQGAPVASRRRRSTATPTTPAEDRASSRPPASRRGKKP